MVALPSHTQHQVMSMQSEFAEFSIGTKRHVAINPRLLEAGTNGQATKYRPCQMQ